MHPNQFEMQAEVWRYQETSGWHFVTLPQPQSAIIKSTFDAFKKNWGSLSVTVTIGQTSWQTSLFPDSKSGSYLLPLKAEVRKKENIAAGDRIRFTIQLNV